MQFSTLLRWIEPNATQLTLSLGLCVIYGFSNFFMKRKMFKHQKMSQIEKRNNYRDTRKYLRAMTFVFLFIIWLSNIQNVVLSMVALAAAIVVATKELIMTFTGGLLIKFNNHFKVGDRIGIGSTRGYVIEKNFTTTKILEIGPEKNSQQTTGDIITLPNSIMLTQPVVNESYFKNYSVRTFGFSLPAEKSFEDFEKNLIEWSSEICLPYIDEAKKNIEKFCSREGLSIPNIEPRVRLVMNEKKTIEVILKFPVMNELVGDIEQALYRKYIAAYGTGASL